MRAQELEGLRYAGHAGRRRPYLRGKVLQSVSHCEYVRSQQPAVTRFWFVKAFVCFITPCSVCGVAWCSLVWFGTV